MLYTKNDESYENWFYKCLYYTNMFILYEYKALAQWKIAERKRNDEN